MAHGTIGHLVGLQCKLCFTRCLSCLLSHVTLAKFLKLTKSLFPPLKKILSPFSVVVVGKKERLGNIPTQQQAQDRPSVTGGFYCHRCSLSKLSFSPNLSPAPQCNLCPLFFMAHFYASIKIPFLPSKNLSHSPRPNSDAACFGKRAGPCPPSIVNSLCTPMVPLAGLSCHLLCFMLS